LRTLTPCRRRRRRQDEIRAHRGRELCGMVNSQFFYIFMLQQVERFRPAVEACRAEVYATVLGVGRALAQAMAPQYPLLVETMQVRARRRRAMSLRLRY
jgi:hypothetical protein